MILHGPDRILQTYFLLFAELASCRGVVLDGMPRCDGNAGAGLELRARLGDLGWYVQDLTAAELRVMAARLLGTGSIGSECRYLLTLSDLQPDEMPTGGRHPGDARFIEVRSSRVLQPTYQKLANHFGMPAREVRALIQNAREKVGNRLRERPARSRSGTV